MMSIKNIFLYISLIVCLMAFSSCGSSTSKKEGADDTSPSLAAQAAAADVGKTPASNSLPVKYQTPAYVVDQNSSKETFNTEETALKVGARIETKKGPQPLWSIMKGLADLKKMNVSWASDVDQNALVDVHINANDDFYEAISNMLRQVDYFHEVQGNTIVVKYKETRSFKIAMPFTKSTYATGTGGNVLGNDKESQNVDGTIELKSAANEFDIWDNIKLNLDTILNIWTVRREGEVIKKNAEAVADDAQKDSRTVDTKDKYDSAKKKEGAADTASEGSKSSTETEGKKKNLAVGQGYYIIDKPVGLITVTAPRPLLEKINDYITTLKKSLYQQIAIEAKIIEVQLNDNSSIGINWSKVLKDFSITGAVEFGAHQLGVDSAGNPIDYKGQVYPYIFANEHGVNETGQVYDSETNTHVKLHDPGRFVSKVSINTANFGVLLNALKEQGNTKVLSNPKISVMNGQPALITVGRNVTYIDKVESTVGTGTNPTINYTVDTQRILSGIGMAITATVLDDDQIIMNLVPVTSELTEPIAYKDFGTDGQTVGLPIVQVREMSTTVKVKDGEMLVIGGLISDVEDTAGEFAPGVGSIPLIRYLFGHEDKIKQKRELIILLKPRII
jgi:MSHA type pilus biogenesis protein MshL